MKKTIYILLILFSTFWTPFTFAACGDVAPTVVTITEAIPWITKPEDCTWTDITTKKCTVTIKPWFWSVMDILWGLIKYATFITALIGVFMLVFSGIQYSMAGFDKESAGKAKGRIQKVLSGIALLFLIGFILNSVAPWIYK